jgi:hypothetical protein
MEDSGAEQEFTAYCLVGLRKPKQAVSITESLDATATDVHTCSAHPR